MTNHHCTRLRRKTKMSSNQISVVEIGDPMYFGPLAGYNTEELDRRGLDQDKKVVQGFRWTSQDLGIKYEMKLEGNGGDTPTSPPHLSARQKCQCQCQCKAQSPARGSIIDEVPTWDEFTQNTTFHGIRYIFDPSAYRMRRSEYNLVFLVKNMITILHNNRKLPML